MTPVWVVSVRFNLGEVIPLNVAAIDATSVLHSSGLRHPRVTPDYEWFANEAEAQNRAIELADYSVRCAEGGLEDAKWTREKMRKAWGK